MENQTLIITEQEASIIAAVDQLITNKFSDKIFDHDIIQQVMYAISGNEITPYTEEIVKHIIFNRQLMTERFL